jgi:uncharacterized membrane protein
MLLFSLWGIAANITDFNVFTILLITQSIGAILGLIYSLIKKISIKELLNISKFTIITALFLDVDTCCLILSYEHIPLAATISLHYLAPLLIPLFAFFILKEKINIKTYVPIVLIGILGSFLIYSILHILINHILSIDGIKTFELQHFGTLCAYDFFLSRNSPCCSYYLFYIYNLIKLNKSPSKNSTENPFPWLSISYYESFTIKFS